MVSRVMRRRRNYMQNGAGIFDLIKKAGKFLGYKKARKLLEYGIKGLDFADNAQKGIASFTGQSGAGMRGGARMRRGNHPITPTQARQLLMLLGNGNGTRRRAGMRKGKGRRRRGSNQKGGFIGLLIKQFM